MRCRLCCGLFLITLFSLPIFSFAQSQIKFEQLTLEDGMSQSTVNSICQDSRGFMWIGTDDGLNRYDGYRFTVYKHEQSDPQSLSHNYILSIFEDRLGALWIGTQGGLNRFDRKTERFSHYKHYPGNPESLSHNIVTAICEDQAGDLWIGTEDGLDKFGREKETFSHCQHDPNRPESLSSNTIRTIYEDRQGALWIATQDGLDKFDREKGTFSHFRHDPDDLRSLSRNDVRSIFEDRQGVLWVGTWGGGLNKFDAKRETFSHYRHDPDNPWSLSDNIIYSIYEGRQGQLWIGTSGGLNSFDREKEAFAHHLHDPSDPLSLSNNSVHSICESQSGLLWFGTLNRLNIYDRKKEAFNHYWHDPNNSNSLGSNSVSSIYEGQSGIIWIGTSDGGLDKFDRQKGTFSHYRHDPNQPNSLSNNRVRSVYEDRSGTLWVGTYGGLNQFDRATGAFKHYMHDPDNPQSISNNRVWSILEDHLGTLWIGTYNGFNRFDRQKGTFTVYLHDPDDPQSLSNNYVRTIYESPSGTLWFGTQGGLNRFDREKEAFTCFQHDPNQPGSLSDNYVRSIYESRQGVLWVGTQSGLNRFDRNNGAFKTYREKDGLPNGVIYGIVEDRKGYLWLSTNMGLARFDPENEVFRNYDVNDGLQSNEFNGGAYCKTRNGEILFGGVKGFNLFHPDDIIDTSAVPPVVFTAFRRYNTAQAGERPIEEKGISEKREVTLSYQDNILVFEFSALVYGRAAKTAYACQLEGFSDSWMNLGTENKVTFTNLDPGAYRLKVKAANMDGIWSAHPAELKVTILPPWWQTWLAYFIYLVLFLGIIYASYRFQLQRKMEQQEAKRLREIDQLKTRLYTNITHEFRTPLTVVLGMSDLIEEFLDKRTYGRIKETVALIKRNSNSLLNLINQLLDLAKLESGNLKLQLVQGDVVRYLQFLTESYQSYADSKQIRLTFYKEIPELAMAYDPDKLLIIVSNLLSNALKFTPEGGKVILHVNASDNKNGRSLIIKVRDTGIGIDESILPRIFDRFYQAPANAQEGGRGGGEGAGTGIGLALTKDLVQLMGGHIKAKSRLGEGTEFSVALPAVYNPEMPMAVEARAEVLKEKTNVFLPAISDQSLEEESGGGLLQKPLALIVEDNPDIVTYLKTCLQQDYQLAVAQNGEEGENKAIELIPDIVVSDVMMPKKNGFELCDVLKRHPFTSHIPIILLTARATLEDRLTGLEHGADAYLKKPFHKDELLIRLRKLIETRKNLQQRFLSLDKQPPATDRSMQFEDAFLQKMRRVVEKNLSDPDFDSARLCREIGMSRSQIYRKLMALTGQPASHFIRSIRLHRAKDMLLTDKLTIAEVAYAVGFRDPSYFSRTFIELFGNSPSTTRNKL